MNPLYIGAAPVAGAGCAEMHPVDALRDPLILGLRGTLIACGLGHMLRDSSAAESTVMAAVMRLHAQQAGAMHWASKPETALLGAVSCMFEERPHAILQPTPWLDLWLAESESALSWPADHFVPPHAATYFHFGPALRKQFHQLRSPRGRRADGTRAQLVPVGSYVLGTTYEHDGAMCRGLGCYLVFRSLLDHPICVLTGLHQPVIDERQTLDDLFVARWREATSPNFDGVETLLSVMARLFKYMNSGDARVVEHRELSDERRRLSDQGARHLAKAERRLSCMCDWLEVGQVL